MKAAKTVKAVKKEEESQEEESLPVKTAWKHEKVKMVLDSFKLKRRLTRNGTFPSKG